MHVRVAIIFVAEWIRSIELNALESAKQTNGFFSLFRSGHSVHLVTVQNLLEISQQKNLIPKPNQQIFGKGFIGVYENDCVTCEILAVPRDVNGQTKW